MKVVSCNSCSASQCLCGDDCKCADCKCREYAAFFDTLGNHNRLKIIAALQQDGPKNVSQIMAQTGLEQTCVSHCLRKLEEGSFVSVERNGKFRVYRLNRRTVEPFMKLIDKHIERKRRSRGATVEV